mmetsp:Transcript_58120/g.152773  ORF Transcript_58120/g.152773 Transcript_58120/m.152773 type:complete len:387 (-) Transcript_58120:176-1336(-)
MDHLGLSALLDEVKASHRLLHLRVLDVCNLTQRVLQHRDVIPHLRLYMNSDGLLLILVNVAVLEKISGHVEVALVERGDGVFSRLADPRIQPIESVRQHLQSAAVIRCQPRPLQLIHHLPLPPALESSQGVRHLRHGLVLEPRLARQLDHLQLQLLNVSQQALEQRRLRPGSHTSRPATREHGLESLEHAARVALDTLGHLVLEVAQPGLHELLVSLLDRVEGPLSHVVVHPQNLGEAVELGQVGISALQAFLGAEGVIVCIHKISRLRTAGGDGTERSLVERLELRVGLGEKALCPRLVLGVADLGGELAVVPASAESQGVEHTDQLGRGVQPALDLQRHPLQVSEQPALKEPSEAAVARARFRNLVNVQKLQRRQQSSLETLTV